MVSIGDTTLPGVSATIESANAITANISSPGDIGMVGGADLSVGNASANTVYRVTTPIRAQQLFGADSQLTKNIVGALGSGAFPVYAAAAEEKTITGEDISGIAGTGDSLAESPLPEGADAATFTVGGTAYTTIETMGDPATKSPASEEAYLNPVTGEYELGTAPSGSADVDYTYHDYSGAIEALQTEQGDVIDFLGTLAENDSVVSAVQSTVTDMEQQKQFAIGVAGAATNIADASSYLNPHDDSRMMLVYPSRNSDGDSVIGSYLGIRAALGIQASPMKTRLRNQTSLAETLTRADKVSLDAENVVVLSNESAGALIENDPTCVATDNTEEAQMADSLSRLIVDYVTDTVLVVSEQFVGGYHSPSTRNQLRSVLNSRLNVIKETDAILSFVVTVEEVDAYTAEVNLGVETVKPLRNVIANITAGDVDTGAIAVSA